MKRLLLAAAAACALTPTASAQTVWRGESVIETITAGCVGNADFQRRIQRGSVYQTIFRPANLEAGNGPDHRLSFTTQRATVRMVMTGAAVPDGSYTGLGFNSVGNRFGLSGTYSAVALSPPTPTLTTPVLLVRGFINDFFGIAGCTVYFRSGLTRRP